MRFKHRREGSRVAHLCCASLLSALGAVIALGPLPALASPTPGASYDIAPGQVQSHTLPTWDSVDTASFHVTAGRTYQVAAEPDGALSAVLQFVAADGSLTDGTFISARGDPTVQGKASADGTLTARVVGGGSYRIWVIEYAPAVFEGTARDMGTGAPLAGMTVSLVAQSPGQYPSTRVTVSTGDDGSYRIVADASDNYSPAWPIVYIIGFSDPTGQREGEYAGGQTDWADAAHYTWEPGAVFSGVDGCLGLPWAVDAVVRDAVTGEAIPGAMVNVHHSLMGAWWAQWFTAVADEQGRVRFTVAAHTNTRLQLQDPSDQRPAQFVGGAYEVLGASDFPTTAGVTSSADILMSPGTPVGGAVRDSGSGQPIAGAVVEAWRNTQASGWVIARSALAGPDGSYALHVLPGSYRLRATDPTGGHAVGWNGGSLTIESAADVTVSGTATTTVGFDLSADTQPPSTVASAQVSWSNTPVVVSLDATDSGDGVGTTYFRVAGASTPGTYTAPFMVTAQGATTVGYWSVDRAGNTETERTLVVRVDSAAPGVTDDSEAHYPSQAVIHLAAGDALSGVAGIMHRLDLGTWVWTEGTIATETVGVEGQHLLEYYATDVAGNQSTHAVTHMSVGTAPLSCSISTTGTTVAYKALVTVTGRIESVSGRLTTCGVELERSLDGHTYVATGDRAVTEMDGTFSISTRPVQNCLLRVRCPAVPGLAGAVSGVVTIATKTLVSCPTVPTRPRPGRRFKTTGTITPSQSTGSRTAQVRCYRLEHGRWVYHKSFWASGKSGFGRSSYAAWVTLSRGTWRLIARHADRSHATTDSTPRTVKVR